MIVHIKIEADSPKAVKSALDLAFDVADALAERGMRVSVSLAPNADAPDYQIL